MVRLERILLTCLAVVLVLLSVTGESSFESSSSLSLPLEESTGGETKPEPLDDRRPTVSLSNTPHLSISSNRKSPTKNKHKCPFGKKKKVPIKKKKKCTVKKNWAAFTSNEPKFIHEVPARKQKNFPITIKITLSRTSNYRIREKPNKTVKNKAKCPVHKNWATNINNKPTGPLSKHETAPNSKYHKNSVNNKLKVPLKKTQKVPIKKKAKGLYKKIMMGASGRNPKCPLRNFPKEAVQKTTKRPVSNEPGRPSSKYQKFPDKKNSKSPLKKNQPVTVNKNSKSPLKKNLPVTANENTKNPPGKKKTVTTTHKRANVQPRVPPRNKPKPPTSNNPEDSLGTKIKRSVSIKIPGAHSSSQPKCVSGTPPPKKPTPPKVIEKVSPSPKPNLSDREKMDILINYQLRLFISLKFPSCIPCRRSLGLQPKFPPLSPIYLSPHSMLGTPSVSSLFESTICEGRLGQFQCPNDEMIQIQSAFYGRQNRYECRVVSMYGMKQNTNCRRDVTAIIRDLCNNRTRCYIYVDNDEMGGDPCPHTYKYLHFTASCV